jgi:hypothetical protein
LSAGEVALAKANALFALRANGSDQIRAAIDAYQTAASGPLRIVSLAGASRACHFLGLLGEAPTKSERLAAFDRGTRLAREGIGNGASRPALSVPERGPSVSADEAELWAWLAANLADRPAAGRGPEEEWRGIAERLVQVAERAGFATGHRLLGRFYAARSGLAGGDVKKSRQHFERALEIAPSPMTRFDMATTWAVVVQDVKRFRTLLRAIIESDERGELGPEAAALKGRAQILLAREKELFGDPAAGER